MMPESYCTIYPALQAFGNPNIWDIPWLKFSNHGVDFGFRMKKDH
jgi:hypothetical protein